MHPIAEDQMGERLTHLLAGHQPRDLVRIEGPHVELVLPERHRRGPHVAVLFEQHSRPRPPGVADAIDERRPADEPAAHHLAQVRHPQVVQHRLEHRVAQPQSLSEVGAAEVARHVEQLEHQLQHLVERQPAVGQRPR